MFRTDRRSLQAVRAGAIIGVLVAWLPVLGAGRSLPLRAQPALTAIPEVMVVSKLAIGELYRSNVLVIGYRSARAAQYIVRGKPGHHAALSVTPIDMVGTHSGDVLRLQLSNAMCAFSVDDGRTWQQFSTGILSQIVQFPSSALANVSEIRVRVGATISCNATQGRGDYEGGVILNAQYVGPASSDFPGVGYR